MKLTQGVKGFFFCQMFTSNVTFYDMSEKFHEIEKRFGSTKKERSTLLVGKRKKCWQVLKKKRETFRSDSEVSLVIKSSSQERVIRKLSIWRRKTFWMTLK